MILSIRRLGQFLLQFDVFFFQRLQAFGLGQIHATVLLVPAVEGGFGYVVRATDFGHRLVVIGLP